MKASASERSSNFLDVYSGVTWILFGIWPFGEGPDLSAYPIYWELLGSWSGVGRELLGYCSAPGLSEKDRTEHLSNLLGVTRELVGSWSGVGRELLGYYSASGLSEKDRTEHLSNLLGVSRELVGS